MKVGFQVGGTWLGDKFSAFLCFAETSVLVGKQILHGHPALRISAYTVVSASH
jgi:hypothetical protein